MNWIRRMLGLLHLRHPAARHADRAPAKAAQRRAAEAVSEAHQRRREADAVAERLERRVLVENHISEGIERLWLGRP